VPFYDMTISVDKKGLLGEIKLHEIAKEKVNLQRAVSLSTMASDKAHSTIKE